MNDTSKSWLQSRTVWGALIAIVASIGGLAGTDIEPGEQADILDAIMAIVAAGGGLLAIFGRIAARKRLI